MCLSQRQLSTMHNAFPLSDANDFYNTANRSPLYIGLAGASMTWDQDYLYRCHCDSLWSVGLGHGETQLAEYFGNAW